MRIDITNHRFGMLTAIRATDQRYDQSVVWVCRCDCGGEKLVCAKLLRRNDVRSCGCRAHWGNRLTHGMADTPMYYRWRNIINRCLNPKVASYKDYGARGIQLCERWRDFAHFYADMGEPPTPKHEIDRIDNNGHYEPDNCQWSTKLENAQNRRDTIRLTVDGITRTLREWSEVTGIKSHTIYARFVTYGWAPERAIERTPHCV